MRIDVHAHYYPDEYVDAFGRLGGAVSEQARRLPGAVLPLDERVDLLADIGIDMQILSVSPTTSTPRPAAASRATSGPSPRCPCPTWTPPWTS
jgi:hypothetical protein